LCSTSCTTNSCSPPTTTGEGWHEVGL
jgi:hypothetical protein